MKSMNRRGSLVHYPLSAIRYPLAIAALVAMAACAPKGDALYARAEKSLEAGEINAAIIDLKNFVKDDPQSVKGRALLASLRQERRDPQRGDRNSEGPRPRCHARDADDRRLQCHGGP